jgi:hypothetical protein
MSCPPSATLPLLAGIVNPIVFEFADGAGTAIDLTGSRVVLVAKRSLHDADEDAAISIVQTDHSDAEGGETILEIDLTELAESVLANGQNLQARLFVVDGDDAISYSREFAIRIEPTTAQDLATILDPPA